MTAPVARVAALLVLAGIADGLVCAGPTYRQRALIDRLEELRAAGLYVPPKIVKGKAHRA